MKSFLELDVSDFAGAVVILDIDGTLAPDGEWPDDRVLEKVRELSQSSDVLLCSNGSQERTKELATTLGVAYIKTSHSKPSRRVVEELMLDGRRVVVVGDKMLTDGLFASNIGATFFPVKNFRGREGVLTRLTYFIDGLIMKVLKPLLPALPFVLLLRPTQWLKNILVFSPIFFAVEIFDFRLLTEAFAAFFLFCFASSAMYVYNDILDATQDRLHPVKRYRPVAFGSVSVRAAFRLIFLLAILSSLLVYFIPRLAPVIIAYVIGNLIYSKKLKHVAVVDMVMVSVFYVLRVIAGGIATKTYMSPWIILCVFFGAMFLVIGKRRSELAHHSKRKVLEKYSKQALDFLLATSATLVITSYGLYSILGGKSHLAIYSTVFVVIVIFRLLNIMYIHESHAEYPETLVFRDKTSLITTICWAVFMFLSLYY